MKNVFDGFTNSFVSFVQELRYSYKQYKIHVIGIPEREETEKGTEEILKQ